jgi:D-inositol-3-phosphate glycosyltransferase
VHAPIHKNIKTLEERWLPPVPARDPIEAIRPLSIAMLSIHSSPLGPLGTRDTGGMSVYVRELARWLGRMGHRVDIFTCMRTGDADTLDLYPNVRLIQLGAGGVADMAKERLHLHADTLFRALDDRIRPRVYDLIHSHYWLSGLVGDLARRHWRIPHMITFHTLGRVKNTTAGSEDAPDLRIVQEGRLVEEADAILAPAERERDNLIRLYRAPERKIRIIPCGVDLELFRPGDRADSRLRLGIPLDRKVVLFVGRFAALKGVDALLEAAADLAPAASDLNLVLVGGDGPESAGFRSLSGLAEALGIQDRVWFPGRIEQDRLPMYYSAADLLVLPSRYESFGLVVLEALACGTPVAATPVGAVEAIIRPGINGAIIDDPSRTGVARGIGRFFEKFGGRALDPAAVRATVAHYGWERIAAVVVRAYNELIEAQSGRRPVHPATAVN